MFECLDILQYIEEEKKNPNLCYGWLIYPVHSNERVNISDADCNRVDFVLR